MRMNGLNDHRCSDRVITRLRRNACLLLVMWCIVYSYIYILKATYYEPGAVYNILYYFIQ